MVDEPPWGTDQDMRPFAQGTGLLHHICAHRWNELEQHLRRKPHVVLTNATNHYFTSHSNWRAECCELLADLERQLSARVPGASVSYACDCCKDDESLAWRRTEWAS